jgi:hypothetical protein
MALPDEQDLLRTKPAPRGEVEVDLEDVGDGVEIEVVDDTPPADRGRKALPPEDKAPTEDELDTYSEDVQKRIRKEVHRTHDERRAKEAVTRERDEAIAAARQLLAEKQHLEARTLRGEDALISQSKDKANLALDRAKKDYEEAYNVGDAKAMAEANAKMAMVAAELREAEGWARNAAQRKESTRQQEDNVVQTQQPTRQAAPEPKPEPEAVDWATKNKWFGTNKRMTNLAYAIHDELLEEGIDPGQDADQYYSKLNTEIRKAFPNYEWADKPNKPKSVVAGVSRSSKSASIRVTLTQSQLSVARRLGLTPQQYAVQVAKLEGN